MSEKTESNPFQVATGELQATAKWLITTFAAIGGILIAGTQLSSIGGLELKSDNPRLWATVLGGLVALGCIGLIIGAVTKVLVGGHVTASNIGKIPNSPVNLNDPLLLGGYGTPTELIEAFQRVVAERDQARQNQNNPAAQAAAQAAAEDREDRNDDIRRLNPIITRTLSAAYYNSVSKNFKDAKNRMYLFGAIGAVGILAFVWGANEPDAPPGTSAFQVPVGAVVRLGDEDQALRADSVGAECVKSPIGVVVLGVKDNAYDTVVIPTDQCKTARLTVIQGVTGEVRPTQAVSIQPPATTTSTPP